MRRSGHADMAHFHNAACSSGKSGLPGRVGARGPSVMLVGSTVGGTPCGAGATTDGLSSPASGAGAAAWRALEPVRGGCTGAGAALTGAAIGAAAGAGAIAATGRAAAWGAAMGAGAGAESNACRGRCWSWD